ncbi:Protein of unknown function, partial [Gryllus bimaculatus]
QCECVCVCLFVCPRAVQTQEAVTKRLFRGKPCHEFWACGSGTAIRRRTKPPNPGQLLNEIQQQQQQQLLKKIKKKHVISKCKK